MAEMLTLREQLRHKPFRKWMAQPPVVTTLGVGPAWRIFVQRQDGGNWAMAEFMSYAKAYKYLREHLNTYHDIALHCRRQAFRPPVVRVNGVKLRYSVPPAEGHSWCPYCRRMTLFRFFINGRHPALKACDATEKRCVICGVRLSFINWRYKNL